MGSCHIINPTDDYIKAKLVKIAAKVARTNGDATVANDDIPVQHGGSPLFNYRDEPMKWNGEVWSGTTVILYCFEDEQSRVDGKDRVEAAMKMWMDTLGGERSLELGYSISIIERYNYAKFKPFYCLGGSKDYQQWNTHLPAATVTIELDGDLYNGAYATLGRSSATNQGRPWGICNGLWGKDITCVTCVVPVLLPPLHEHFPHRYTSGIGHVNRPYLWLRVR
jgi:hypothetical protein